MNKLFAWLQQRFEQRPWWMNALMVTCALIAYVYIPWDFFFKPVADDREAWLGLLLRGRAAKITEPLHFVIYAAGAYGFWHMKSWMWPWAAIYTATVAFGAVVWPLGAVGGLTGVLIALASATPVAIVAYALWDARYLFEPQSLALRKRYGDWALITGASAGLGAEFARALAREGVSCVLTARREDRLTELAADLENRHGIETRVIACDLAAPDGPDELAAAVADIDLGIVVNNAGAGYAGRFDKQDAGRLRQMIDLNCTAPVVLTHRLLPAMIERGRGAILVVASVAGRQPIALHGVYSATKAFDLLFGESLWVEMRDRGIDVTVLMPGPVATEFEAVAGETRPDHGEDEHADHAVEAALAALGRQPSVVSGTWMNWARANANRFLPRAVMACLAGDFMARQTPSDMR